MPTVSEENARALIEAYESMGLLLEATIMALRSNVDPERIIESLEPARIAFGVGRVMLGEHFA